MAWCLEGVVRGFLDVEGVGSGDECEWEGLRAGFLRAMGWDPFGTKRDGKGVGCVEVRASRDKGSPPETLRSGQKISRQRKIAYET